MPAYSFMKQFVEPVETGAKTHTIRAKRKHRPQAGQRFVGYYAMRTKQCRKLLESTITRVQDIQIFWAREIQPIGRGGLEVRDGLVVEVDGIRLAEDERNQLATRDGFADWDAFEDFWIKTHRADVETFDGDIIHWLPPTTRR